MTRQAWTVCRGAPMAKAMMREHHIPQAPVVVCQIPLT
jgi:hypothetical protein